MGCDGRKGEVRGGEALLNFHFIFKKPTRSRVIQARINIVDKVEVYREL